MNETVDVQSRKGSIFPEKRQEFSGKLLVLNEGTEDTLRNGSENRLTTGSKSFIDTACNRFSPSNSTCDTSTSDQCSQDSTREIIINPIGLVGRRLEKKLPTVKRRNESKLFSESVGTCKQNVKLDFHLNDHAVGTVAQNVQNHQEYMTQEDDSLRQCFNKLAGPILEQSRDINSDTYTLSPNEANYSTGYNRNGSESRLPSDGPTSSFKRAPIELLGMFLDALMKKDYKEAQRHCDDILLIEPENSICCEFKTKLEEKLVLAGDIGIEDNIYDADKHSGCYADNGDIDEDDDKIDNDVNYDVVDDYNENGNDDDSDESSESGTDSSKDISSDEDISREDSDGEDLRGIDINALNLFVGGLSFCK